MKQPGRDENFCRAPKRFSDETNSKDKALASAKREREGKLETKQSFRKISYRTRTTDQMSAREEKPGKSHIFLLPPEPKILGGGKR
jgi:hypothetical protein